MFSVKIEADFSSAHNLRGYKGKCEELHGHNWKIELVASSEKLDKAGMVLDFKYLKAELKKILEKTGFKIEKIEKRGGFFEMISIVLLYIFKWIFRREVPFKKFLEQKRDKEYFVNKNGFVTIFVKAAC